MYDRSPHGQPTRRTLLAGAGVALTALAGCLEGDDQSDDDETDTTSEEECTLETRTESEQLVDDEADLEADEELTKEFSLEDGDTVHADVSVSNDQEIRLEVVGPDGDIVHSDDGHDLEVERTFEEGGEGTVRLANLGERTEPERDVLADDRIDVPAGSTLAPQFDLEAGDTLEYRVRRIDGARPTLRLEAGDGEVLRDHAVAAVIDDAYTVEEDGRYYVYAENTAFSTTGVWDYTFERVTEVPIPTTVSLAVEREYDIDVEVCE